MMNRLRRKQAQAEQPPVITDVEPDRYLSAIEQQVDAVNSQVAQIDVEDVADLLARRRYRRGRGPLYRAWMISSPFCGIALLASLTNQEPVTAFLSAVGLITIRLLHHQAMLLDQDQTVLQHTDLGPEWFGALAEALHWPDRFVQGCASQLLTKLLPHLAAASANTLSAEQRICLYRRLGWRNAISNPELARAILQALPSFGDEAALPHVRRLAGMPAINADLREISVAAHAALPMLERRIARSRD